MGNKVWSMVDSLMDEGSWIDRSMVENGGMVGSMMDTMGNMLGSMVDIKLRSMNGSMVGSMVEGGNNRMGSMMKTLGTMSNSVNTEAIFVDGLMAMLGRGS